MTHRPGRHGRLVTALALSTVLAACLTACGSDGDDGGNPFGPPNGTGDAGSGGGSGGGSGNVGNGGAVRTVGRDNSAGGPKVNGVPRGPGNLASLPGGTAPLPALREGGTPPDACTVLTARMAEAVVPGSGGGTEVTILKSSTPQPTCTYRVRTASGTAASIVVDFAGSTRGSDADQRAAFAGLEQNARNDPDYRDLDSYLGDGTSAFSDGTSVYVLAGSRRFRVGGTLTPPDVNRLREEIEEPIARNISQRLGR